MIPAERAAEYRAVVDDQDARGKEFVRAAWTAGHKFMEYNDSPAEIAQIIGRSADWVSNRMDIARLSMAQLDSLMDEKGIDSLAKIRMEVIRLGYIPPTGRDHPKITYMPPTLITSLIDKGYTEEALRNLMRRVGLALQNKMVTVTHVLDHPEQEFTIELNL